MVFLYVDRLHKEINGNLALNSISFKQKQLQKIAIAGETGSGKSTLLKIIAGLVQPDEGEVSFKGNHVDGPAEKLVAGHPSIAYLSQQFELQKFLRVEQILGYANELDDDKAAELYEICHITHLLSRKTDQLSGGERQRIALARLLTKDPEILLLDEPFSNLDMPHKGTMKSVIEKVTSELGITSILVAHDPQDMLSWADEIIVLKAGQIVQKGNPEEIYKSPSNDYVAGLFGKYIKVKQSQFKYFNPNLKINSDIIFLRPEDIKVVDNGSVKGNVKKIRYFGSYYELSVAFKDLNVLVNVKSSSYKLNQQVFLGLTR